jgi:hypothetical protein
MRGNRLISAIRELLGKAADTSEVEPLAKIPAVPLPAGAMPGWRSYRCMSGPYERFRVHYPRNWNSIVGEGGDPIHLKPPSGDVAVTVSANIEPVFGPQGIIDLIEGMANSRGVPFERRTVQIDRWEDDGWAGSWAWRERDPDGTTRLWRMLVLGHEQGNLIGMVNGAEVQLVEHSARCEEILTSIVLPPADVLAPESFPLALCELLNDRRGGDEPYWYLSEEGHLCCADLIVRLANIYRSYLLRHDLDEVAAQLDLRTQGPSGGQWQGRSWEEIRDRLRVVLRRKDTIAGLDIVSIPMHGGLVACPVLDSKEQITFIPNREASRWGLGPGAILTRAVATLDAESSVNLIELRDSKTDALKGFRIAADDGYDSGRLLCPSLRMALEDALGEGLLVAMPAARSVLVLRDSLESRKLLSDTASSNYQSRARPLSEDLWLWTEAGLELLEG